MDVLSPLGRLTDYVRMVTVVTPDRVSDGKVASRPLAAIGRDPDRERFVGQRLWIVMPQPLLLAPADNIRALRSAMESLTIRVAKEYGQDISSFERVAEFVVQRLKGMPTSADEPEISTGEGLAKRYIFALSAVGLAVPQA